MTQYGCGGYLQEVSDTDSIAVDSLGVEMEQEVILDELGNMVVKPKEHHEDANQQPQDDEPQAAEEPKEE
jgi:hypothetical protein